MEIENQKSCTESDKALSLIQTNNYFATKILSRTSSVNASSCFDHCAIPGEIPFKWELKPGLPKDPPKQLIDHYLPSSYYVHDPPPTCNTSLTTIPRARLQLPSARVTFWNKLNIKNKVKMGISCNPTRARDHDDHATSDLKGFKLTKLPKNNDYFTSSCGSISSSSSTYSFSTSFQSSKIQNLAKGLKKCD